MSDEQIIESIRAGDARNYALLVDRHKDKAFTLAFRFVRDRQDAEELVQDAFVRAYRSLDSFRGAAKFSTWLYRILYNLCMTKVSRSRQPCTHDIDQEEMLDNTFVDEQEFLLDEGVEREEFRSILIDEVNKLPEKFCTAITLFYLQEMTYEEIVEVLNLPMGTVKTNLFRARNLLRERMVERLKGELV